ncbi:MAG: SDR family NAD(P)-dependent oxidoreductase [Bryobacteraceae bacterium]|nr:SDR family NAD(P)-dependent oxidoreductase [Bryobacteraceae bacterium]
MEQFKGRVAVVTGGASGIGFALARRLAREGCRIVLADIEQAELERARDTLSAEGAEVLAVRTDVARFDDVERLAEQTLRAFGAAHIVCNNAGVAGGFGPMWEISPRAWDWTLGVNLQGVIHGVRVFVPILLKQEEGHIVNTASAAGLVAFPFAAPYGISKFGVVALSEALALELKAGQADVGVSVLCPAYVATRIAEVRNVPGELAAEWAALGPLPAEKQKQMEEIAKGVAEGIPPEAVADAVLDGIRQRRLYILTHQEMGPYIEGRMKAILAASPSSRVQGAGQPHGHSSGE